MGGAVDGRPCRIRRAGCTGANGIITDHRTDTCKRVQQSLQSPGSARGYRSLCSHLGVQEGAAVSAVTWECKRVPQSLQSPGSARGYRSLCSHMGVQEGTAVSAVTWECKRVPQSLQSHGSARGYRSLCSHLGVQAKKDWKMPGVKPVGSHRYPCSCSRTRPAVYNSHHVSL